MIELVYSGKRRQYGVADGDETPTIPLTLDESDVASLINTLRQNPETYKWVVNNLWSSITGDEDWRLDVETGNKKPGDVMTVTGEALLLLLLENHSLVWNYMVRREAQGEEEANGETRPGTKYTKVTGSTKEGWSEAGLLRFQELVEKVTVDRESEGGKAFETMIQASMKQDASEENGRKKKRRRVIGETTITSVVNELPTDDESSDEEGEEE